jgi:hypothetical protein
MNYYLVVYDHESGKVRVEDFGDASDAALARRFELERRLRDETRKEVVVLSAESRDALKRTHARYFKNVRELAAI